MEPQQKTDRFGDDLRENNNGSDDVAGMLEETIAELNGIISYLKKMSN